MNVLDLNFIEKAKELYPVFFEEGVKILEIGAADVNGNVRGPFAGEFTGIDWAAGKNVDIVVPAKETCFADGSFDVILSCNHLEHDPDWEDSIGHNLLALRPGGLLLLRWAGIGSAPHGPEFDPHGEHGYYPKSMAEVLTFLLRQNMNILLQNGDHNPCIGPMLNIIAAKK